MVKADPVHTYLGLGRLPRARIVVNVDPAHRGYMWAIECGPPSEDAKPLTGRVCNAPSPISELTQSIPMWALEGCHGPESW
ncbi:hypothetical protein TorRG33x02_292120 [Trema orientale]|uniref:Uncharacterized protein n=1 Tax=Trema orientale TaxID=63057 RepID=A0A2P5CAM0_TREOI|nr:hypothetical protein TorRG33x02_292120 [Trema orientale]